MSKLLYFPFLLIVFVGLFLRPLEKIAPMFVCDDFQDSFTYARNCTPTNFSIFL